MPKRLFPGIVVVMLLGGLAGIGYLTRERWQPILDERLQKVRNGPPAKDEHGHEAPGEHGHAGHAHGPATDSVTLSDQAVRNLGLRTGEISLGEYWRTITVPGIVAERQGHSERRVTTTLQGVVKRVRILTGQFVHPGDPIIDMEVTSDAIATAQSSLLKTIKELELVVAELERIDPLVKSGVIMEKVRLEKEYERKRLESARQVQIQELAARGLSPDQIREILDKNSLLREITIVAPGIDAQVLTEQVDRAKMANVNEDGKRLPNSQASNKINPGFSVEEITVFPGKLVQPGEEICDLGLHFLLDVQGTAFEREATQISQCLERKWPVKAIFESEENKPLVRENMNILYIENDIDPATRTFRFHIPIVNEILIDNKTATGTLYRTWRFKPGQRVRLLVPVEHWVERIVLPSEALVREGPDAFVFRSNGKQMERVAVHVEFMDAQNVVVANDGSLFPGDFVAQNNAYQLNLAIKKQSGSGIDPHAGHNH